MHICLSLCDVGGCECVCVCARARLCMEYTNTCGGKSVGISHRNECV